MNKFKNLKLKKEEIKKEILSFAKKIFQKNINLPYIENILEKNGF